MPLRSTFGAASERAWRPGNYRPLAFRGADGFVSSGASATINFSAIGAQVGDLAIVAYFIPLAFRDTTALAGWTKLSYTWPSFSYVTAIYYKVLTALDLVSTITGLNNGGDTVIYAAYGGGASSVSVASTTHDGFVNGASHDTAAYTPSHSAKAVVSLLQNQGADTTESTNNGFTVRTHVGTGGSSSHQAIADQVNAASYNGSPVTWSHGGNEQNLLLAMLELS